MILFFIFTFNYPVKKSGKYQRKQLKIKKATQTFVQTMGLIAHSFFTELLKVVCSGMKNLCAVL